MKNITNEQREHWKNSDAQEVRRAEVRMAQAVKELKSAEENKKRALRMMGCDHPDRGIIKRDGVPMCKVCGSDPLFHGLFKANI